MGVRTVDVKFVIKENDGAGWYENGIIVINARWIDEDSAIELLWLHMKEEEYQMPPKNYVPDDPKWRIEGEDYEDWKKVRKNIMVMDQYIWRKK